MLVSYLTLNLIAVVIRPTQQSWSPVFLRRGVNSGSSSVFGEPEEPWGRHRPVSYEYDWSSVCRGEKQEEQQNKKKKPERVPSAACWRDWRLNEAEGFPSASLVMKLFVYVHLLRREDSPLQQESLASLLSKHTWEGCCHYLHSVHINRGGQLAECAIKLVQSQLPELRDRFCVNANLIFRGKTEQLQPARKADWRFIQQGKRCEGCHSEERFIFLGGGGSECFITLGVWLLHSKNRRVWQTWKCTESLELSFFLSSHEYSHQFLWASVPPWQREIVWKCRYATFRSSPSCRPHWKPLFRR